MKKVIITFGDEKYDKSLELLKKSALKIGKIDDVTCYSPGDFDDDFSLKNRYILSQPRGCGYWLWKPYFLLEKFKELKENDIVLYSDAGLNVISDLNPLFDILANDKEKQRMVFKIPGNHLIKEWTKKDCFSLMKCDTPEYQDGIMVNGALSLWKVNDENKKFIKEWLLHCKDFRILTDAPNMLGPDNFQFKGHRHDQSVLSLLAKREKFEIFRDPSQYGNSELTMFTNSDYTQLFHHHRNFKH